jgi:hypothetical protein
MIRLREAGSRDVIAFGALPCLDDWQGQFTRTTRDRCYPLSWQRVALEQAAEKTAVFLRQRTA